MLDEVAELVSRNTSDFKKEVEDAFDRTQGELLREMRQVVTMAYERRRELMRRRIAAQQSTDHLLQTATSRREDKAIFDGQPISPTSQRRRSTTSLPLHSVSSHSFQRMAAAHTPDDVSHHVVSDEVRLERERRAALLRLTPEQKRGGRGSAQDTTSGAT